MNEREKNASVEYILARGLARPQSARERIAEMIRRMGFRFIFWDMGYSLFFALLSLAAVVVLFRLAPENSRCSAAVACAPMLFLLIVLFAETSERAFGLYELKQTCRYTVTQIAALRVICYSFAGTAFTVVVAAESATDAREFLSLFPLCLFALFLCAVLEIHVMRVARRKWANAVCSAVWILVNILLPLLFGKEWESLLRETPPVVSAALAIVVVAAFIRQTSKMLGKRRPDLRRAYSPPTYL
jgi:hypothetical protein